MPKVKSSTSKLVHLYEGSAPVSATPEQRISLAWNEIREVIYGVRSLDHLIKIGCCTNFTSRMASYAINQRNAADRILFLMPGTFEDEQVIHETLRPYLARGREHYHPVPEVIEYVNMMRADFGIPPIAA